MPSPLTKLGTLEYLILFTWNLLLANGERF